MRCNASWRNGAWGGGVFVSSPAYADGYVDGTGNNIYYGFKTDAKYAEAHFNIDVEYYDTFENAKKGGTEGKDPLGKFVRVHYLSNCNNNATADDWKFRPMWWFGVPAGLKDPQDIQFKRIEKLTKEGKKKVKPAGSSQYVTTDANGYGAVSDKHFNNPKQWNNISNYYFSDKKILASKGWKQLMGLGTKDNKGYDDKGNTAQQWGEYQKQTQGLKGIFVDWESAGQRWYDMTYVSEMTDDAWKERDKNPLRFAAGVYRFAGNWHYAVGQKHNTPKIADHLKLAYPEVTKVKKLDDVSPDEQKAIKEKIEKANESTTYYKELVADNGVVVNKDGSATITFKDKTTRTMPASLLVTKDESDSDKYKPTLPDATPVVNPNALTEDDKKAVIDAFKEKNKGNKDFNDHLAKEKAIEFDADGKNLVVTYEDGSTAKIPASELVYQGPKISDWAPYVVPDVIEVENLSSLTTEEQKQVTDAFDKANADLDVYTAAKKDGKTPVSFDKEFKNAIITWADGSTTEIPSWQFLKQKPKTTPSPEPQPPAPTPAAEKEFIVEAPKNQSSVDFDPFNAKESDLTDDKNKQALTSIKEVLKKCAAKDAKDNNTSVTIKDVEFKIVDGKGVVVFHADNYKDATYPMSVFLKQKAAKQTSQTPSTETKTETDTEHPEDTFTYKVTKTEIDGDTPTAPDAIKAMKQFVKDNYDNVKDSELANVTDSIPIAKTWTPKQGTKNMGSWDGTDNTGPVTSIQPSDGFGIQVNGHQWMEDEGWSAGTEGTLFTIKPSDLYVKKNSSQPQKDTTIDNLKKQAKDLLKKRTKTDGLSNDDLKRAGIVDPDKLNDAKIDGLPKDQTTEKYLRDLIRKLTDAKKAKRKYNEPAAIKVKDPNNPTEDDFKKAVKAFFDANYDGQNNFQVTTNGMTIPYLPSASDLKPKSGTVDMEIADDNIKSVTSSETGNKKDYKSIVFKDQNGKQLFMVSITYSKEETTPTPKPDDKQLQQMKDDAKKIIDKNPYLTPEQKKQFKDKIDDPKNGPKDQKGIQNILNEAKEQGEKNKQNTSDPNVQQIINNNKGGGDEKKQHELDAAKEAANKAIDALKNLSEQEKKDLKGKVDKANDINGVNNVVDEAKKQNELNGVKKEAKEVTFVFLDHGKGGKDDSSDPNHADDAALNELLGTTPAEDSTLKTLADKLKEGSKATAEEIKNALAAAKRQNAINEENAKNAGIAKLDAKQADLDAAYNALTDDQKKSAKEKYDAAVSEINTAKGKVNSATKPSDIKTAVASVKDETINAANKAIEDAKGTRDTSGNTNDNADALNKEKEAQKKRIQDSSLSDADKQKAIDDINNAKKLGDPTGIADRALKAQKIKDALKAIDDFKHLNKAQKDAFKAIINTTDAGNHKDDNGNDTGVDDIDDALANAANTDNAMARLEELKEIADKFAKGDAYKNSNDANKKTAFDNAATAAGAVLDRDKGDAKDADQVNELYKDLLKAMRDIDPQAKSAGLKTDALKNEIESDNKLKPDTKANPATKGDSVYTTASKAKKDEFDKALNEAQTVLNGAKKADISTADKEATEQKEIDAALDKLIKARLALDGVNTKSLEQQIAKDADIKKSVEYTKASDSKKKAYDDALAAAQKLITDLTTPSPDGSAAKFGNLTLDSKDAKQKALDAALKALSDAAEALDGKDTTPVPPSDDDNTGSGSESDSGSGTSTSTSGGVNKQNLINQINTTENPGGANPGSGAAGTNPSTPGAGAQGAGMGAVTPGSGSGAAGTGAAGAASAGVDNKAVNNAVENAPEVKQADAAVKQAAATLDEALAQAKRVAADPHATQAQVDAAAAKLADARKALADAQANAAKVRAAVRSRVIKGMRSRGSASTATGANVATAGLMATMIAAIGGAFVTRRMRTKHANRD